MFVDVDGVPGLLRIPELTWGRISHPSDVAAVGDTVRFQILQLNDPDARPHEHFNGSVKILLPKPYCAGGDAVS
jgi:small subunit ribosomal protein S1